MATISSLGLGSQVLTQDVVDKLKAAEESARIKPITNDITKYTNKKNDLSLLITAMSSLKSPTMDLADSATYLKRTATSSSTDISISASSGVATQDMTMSVSQLAQNHVMQSKGYSSSSSTIASSSGTMTLKLNGSTYNIAVTAGMTLEQLSQKINDSTSGKITASVLNTGSGSTPYVLTIKSNSTGASNTIEITQPSGMDIGKSTTKKFNATPWGGDWSLAAGDFQINGVDITMPSTGAGSTSSENADDLVTAINNQTALTGVTASNESGIISLTTSNINGMTIKTKNGYGEAVGKPIRSTLDTDKDGVDDLDANGNGSVNYLDYDGSITVNSNTLQTAQDATFTYNGISMVRSSNTITDIISGATFTLNKVTTSTANLSIKQDTTLIPTLVDSFVSAFNTANSKIKDLTKYDSSTKTTGTLQGETAVSSIYSNMAQLITKIEPTTGKSLMDYGFSLDKSGTLSVDKTKLTSAISSDPKTLEKVFRGASEITKGTYTGTNAANVPASNTAVGSGSIIINGISISSVTTQSTNTAEQNAQLFVAAINSSYDSTGVKAYTNGSGKIILENDAGGTIKLTTTALAAQESGLTTGAITESTVAAGKSTQKKGIFADLNTYFASLISKSTSSLNQLSTSFQSLIDSNTTEKTNTQKSIDTKYEQLAAQFAAYDKLISKYQQSFASLQMQINNSSS